MGGVMKMSATTGLALLAAAVVAAGCTTGGQVRKDTTEPPPAPAPAKPVDPQAGLKSRFETAYFEIACQASNGKDPLSSVSPIEVPAQYLERIEKIDGGKRDRAERALHANGFAGIAEFRDLLTRMKSDAKYWQNVQDRYIDELIKCAQ